MCEDGFVPSKLVFEILPRFPILSTDLPNQEDRIETIKTVQAEMNSIVVERRVFKSLTKNILAAFN